MDAANVTLDATIPDVVTLATTVVANVAPSPSAGHESHLFGVR